MKGETKMTALDPSRIYEQGTPLNGNRVYLCNRPESEFPSVPWKTKKICGRFNVRDIPQVHISVSKNEWNGCLKDEKDKTPKKKPKKKKADKPSILKPKPEPAELEHQRKELINLLIKIGTALREKEEKDKDLQQKPKNPPPDPDINNHSYNLVVEISNGSVGVKTKDLSYNIRAESGEYSARMDNEGWVLIRFGKNEYGLLLRQWMQYQMGCKEMATVVIRGLEEPDNVST